MFLKRLLSLDLFRGLTIAGMIVVNCPGADETYAPLRHSPWHGCTFADLVFPAFLVIMGVSLSLSLGRRLEHGQPRRRLLRQAALRAAIIFGLGLLSAAFGPEGDAGLRVPGVLQRIAVCYFLCALVFLRAPARAHAGLAAAGLAGYWALLAWVPAPGRLPGDLSPEGNLVGYLDRLLLGGHLSHHGSDPEGLLSTFPAACTALLGVVAGLRLRSTVRHSRRAGELLGGGLACATLGGIWAAWFPLNKELWTSSFALLSGGLALVGLSACYAAVEILGARVWIRPFLVLGRNPLLSYFLSELVYGVQEFVQVPGHGDLKSLFAALLFGGWLSPPAASLAYALLLLALVTGLMEILYRRKIFLKV